MPRKKKSNLFLMIIIAILTLVCLEYTRTGYENFTNVKENFDLIRKGNTCGTCSAS